MDHSQAFIQDFRQGGGGQMSRKRGEDYSNALSVLCRIVYKRETL